MKRKLKVPEAFKEFKVHYVVLPDYPELSEIYHIPMRCIYVNKSAREGANIIKAVFNRYNSEDPLQYPPFDR